MMLGRYRLASILMLSATSVLSALAQPRIATGAIRPITKADYPKTYAEWGPQGIKKVNALLRAAAEKASQSPDCDRVAMIELSGDRSVPGKKIVFFVDCANGARLYVADTDLVKELPVRSQTVKMGTLSDADALDRCKAAVRSKLENPLTFSPDLLSTRISRASSTGNVLVEFGFDAKNRYGAVLPAKARCILTDQNVEATITKK